MRHSFIVLLFIIGLISLNASAQTKTKFIPPPTSCEYFFPTVHFDAAGGQEIITIPYTGSDCTPNITTRDTWLQIANIVYGSREITFYLRCEHNYDPFVRTGLIVVDDQAFTVNQDATEIPADPPQPTVQNTYGSSTLTRATPPTGIVYYWQGSSCGTSKTNSNSTYTVTQSGTYYLRAYAPDADIWSNSCSSASASVLTVPQPPQASFVYNCGSTDVTRANPSSGFVYYWQTSSNGTSTSNSAQTRTITSNSTLYLRARHTSTGTWSSATTVSVTVYADISDYSMTGGGSYYFGESGVSLGLSDSQTGVTYQLKRGSSTVKTMSGTGNALNFGTYTTEGTYTVYAYRSGTNCSKTLSDSKTITLLIPQPIEPTIEYYCEQTNVVQVTSPTGLTYYWQSSINGTSTSDASETKELTASTTLYLRAYHASSGNWSDAISINAEVKDRPQIQIVKHNYDSVICFGIIDKEVELQNSELGVNYYVMVDDKDIITETERTGTGGKLRIAIPNTTIGKINIVGIIPEYIELAGPTKTKVNFDIYNCISFMNGDLIILPPLLHDRDDNLIGGGSYLFGETAPEILLNNSQTRVKYQLIRDGQNVGAPIDGNGSTISFGNQSVQGEYYARGYFEEADCDDEMYGPVYVTIEVPAPLALSVVNDYGSSTITRPDPPAGLTYYWQGTSCGELINNTSESIVVTNTDTYYLRAQHDATGNWSTYCSGAEAVILVQEPPSPSIQDNCDETIVTRNNPPAGYRYCWQTTSSGKNTENYDKTLSFTSDTTIFLRRWEIGTNNWSNAKTVNVTIKESPNVFNINESGTYCPGSPLVAAVSIDGFEEDVNYTLLFNGFAIPADQAAFGEQRTFIPRNGMNPGLYQVQANKNGCILLMNGEINILPDIEVYSVTGGGQFYYGDSESIGLNGSQTEVTYKLLKNGSNTGFELQGTGNAITFSNIVEDGIYTIKAYFNGQSCEEAMMSGLAQVEMLIPEPTGLTINNTYGSALLTRTNPPAGITYYWQGTSCGTSKADSNVTFTALEDNQEYFLSANLDGTSKWSLCASIQTNFLEVQRPSEPDQLQNCNFTTVTTEAPPNGFTDFWQENYNGKSILDTALRSEDFLNSETLYLRRRHDASGIWSSARTIEIEVTQAPPTYQIAQEGTHYISSLGEAFAIDIEEAVLIGPYIYKLYKDGEVIQTSEQGPSFTINTEPGIYTMRTYLNTQDILLKDCYSQMEGVVEFIYIQRFDVLGGGTYNYNEDGKEITLSGSQDFMQYYLEYHDYPLGDTILGTGGTISFGNQYFDGPYLVRAIMEGTGINILMNGSARIDVNVPSPDPIIPSTGCGPITLTRPTVPAGLEYYWQTSASGYVKTAERNTETWAVDESGTYYLRAYHNASNEWSIARSIDVEIYPEPRLDRVIGGGTHCNYNKKFDVHLDYSMDEIMYQLKLNGNDVGDPIMGNGSTLKFGKFDEVGTYTVVGYNPNCGSPVEMDGSVEINEECFIIDAENVSTNGTLSFEVVEGTAPFLCEWNDITHNESTNTITRTGLSQGSYNVTITDANDYSKTLSFEVVENTISLNTNKNYIETIVPRVKRSTDTAIIALSHENKIQNVTYFDGLGRAMQQIQIKESPKMKDIVQHIEYDDYGRKSINYLPFTEHYNGSFIDNPITDIDDFYTSEPNVAHTAFHTSEVIFDNSPLNRVMEQGAPGLDWQVVKSADISTRTGHTVRMDYLLNAPNEVRIINATDQGFTSNIFYAENTLYKNIIINENNDTTVEFKDNEGKVILIQSLLANDEVSTYYVYDDYGLLRYVIPPEAVEQLSAGNWNVSKSDDIYKLYCYGYKYDGRSRMIEKKIPGADKIYMLYNKLDQLVLTQDGNLRDSGQWLFNKYDIFGNLIMTGICIPADTALDDLKANIEAASLYESFNSTLWASNKSYTNNAFPTTSNKTIYSVTYYNTYDIGDGYVYAYDQPNTNYEVDNSEFTKGLVTLELVNILGADKYLTTAYFYDEYGRLLQTYKENYLEGDDIVTNHYQFSGEVDRMHIDHRAKVSAGNYENITIEKLMTYDHAGRLKETKIIMDDDIANAFIVSSMEYNELGQLMEKNLHSIDEGLTFLQSIDYAYNIRGWMTKINDAENLANGTDYNKDAFAMQLLYNEGMTDLNGTAQYNGNISGYKWQGAYLPGLRAYGFGYDELNRLKYAKYAELSAGNWTQHEDAFSVHNLEYDKNGNILNLDRNKYDDPNLKTDLKLTQLDYHYNGNQLFDLAKTSIDYVPGQSVLSGGITNPVENYFYDKNGNLVQDNIKGINGIIYNHLNLPMQIYKDTDTKERTIAYAYDALGVKHGTFSSQTGDSTFFDSTYYLGSFIYAKNRGESLTSLDYILDDEGKIVNSGGIWQYEYFIKDHLGNTRVVLKDNDNDGQLRIGGANNEILQESNYYPFGLTFAEGNINNSNKYLYNGKEMQDDFDLDWLDYGARFYDPEIVRWYNIDPLVEKYSEMSPYIYCANNPILYKDPDGREIWIYYQEEKEVNFKLCGKEFSFSYNTTQKMEYTQGMEYSGDNEFVSTSVGYLNRLNSTEGGNIILNELTGSSNKYNLANKGTGGFLPNENGGGTIYAGALMDAGKKDWEKVENISHEMFHGYQSEMGYPLGMINTEVDAYIFGNRMAKEITGMWDLRLGKKGYSKSAFSYEQAMKTLINDGYNQDSYIQAIKKFKTGSSANRNGQYNHLMSPYIYNNKIMPSSLLYNL